MGLMDKMSKTFGLSRDEEEKEIDTTEKEELKVPKFESNETSAGNAGYSGKNVVDFSSAINSREREKNSAESSASMTKSKITTIKPTSFNDAPTIANCLRDQIPVVINFEDTSVEEANRIVNFISGSVHALNGTLQQVSQKVFVCAPSSVTVTYNDEKKKSSDRFVMPD